MAEERNPLPPPPPPPLGSEHMGTVAVLPTVADIQSAVASTAPSPLSRCLEGCSAVNARLAAMVVSKYSKGRIGTLSIRGDVPDPDSKSHPQSNGFTDYGLQVVGSSFPYLKALSLWGCLEITCRGLACMARGCGLLEKLDLCECPLVSDEGMAFVACNLKNITKLSIDSCQNIGNATLKAFGAHTPTIKSLCIAGCPLVGDEGIAAILEGLPNLKRLKLGKVFSHLPVVLEHVRRVKPLAHLALDKVLPSKKTCIINADRLHDPFRAVGQECKNLKNIFLCRCIDDEGLLVLAQGAALLESLTLKECAQISLSGLVGFLTRYGKNLKGLSLVKCKGIVEPTDWAVSPLMPPPSCSKLERLVVNRCPNVGDGLLMWMGSVCWDLREVELVGLGGISDKGLLSLLLGGRAKLLRPSLERVWLSGCAGLTDVSLFCIASVFGEGLRSLGLGQCLGVSSQCLQAIASCCPNLLDLDLSGSLIEDGAFVCLPNGAYCD
ncbi:EIN3-binding F-box protein 2 [Nymphaea thermarum]|nr:EIN3-binding F-box protein 2 [Nymphaea thermarum]